MTCSAFNGIGCGEVLYLSSTPPSAQVELFADEPDVMNTTKVAELLDVDPSTVRREIDRGRLRATHVGRCVRITKKSLVEYLEGVDDGL